ncbi:exocyst complex component EXO70B1 [Mercurialis annua]|uniref:exocyst complex component EXO70B1 n=1 Tax=Mercurialis annua TaxID=3986 RepID=UPI0021601433|nr:exocyst complex component EXO70B1 [Mercurialis annua]
MDNSNNQPENAEAIAPNEQDVISDSQSGESEPNFEDASSVSEMLTISQALDDVDRFLDSSNGNHNLSEIPMCVETLLEMVEKKMGDYDSDKFGHNSDEDSSFLDCLTRISKWINVSNQSVHPPAFSASLNRASGILHLAMSLLDNEFRSILDSCNRNSNNINNKKASMLASFSLHYQDCDRNPPPELPDPNQVEESFPGYSQESISNMSKIANAMVLLGYEKECCMAYSMIRRIYLNAELEKLGYSNISIEDVQKMNWDTLESEIAAWNDVLKHSYAVLFPTEQSLCESVFSEFPSVSKRLFSDLAQAVTVRFLNFAEAVALSKRSGEKLFKFLDMYETLRDIIPAVYKTDSDELKSETSSAKNRLGEAAVSIFCDLENSIRRDHSKTPVPSGAVHPLTRYTMNYLKYACEYKNTLEQVFLQHQKPEDDKSNSYDTLEVEKGANEDGTQKISPFSIQWSRVMDLLDKNLEIKSNLYRDPALRYMFLMNNGRYILKKIKESVEINEMMGATWCRKRSTDLRQYHKGYTRETWSRLLQCLNHEGLLVNGKVVKPVLKEKFKMFNAMFDEIHKNQSTWVVCDEQLQLELRVSVSAIVIPAYRAFLGRFQQHLTSGRQMEKYIKYQSEDLENLIDVLFNGNPNSMAKRRT